MSKDIQQIELYSSKKKNKKYVAVIEYKSGKEKYVDFGGIKTNGEPYEDYTIHKDDERKKRYIQRHKRGGENWKKSGITTAGFWSLHLLWNKKTISASIKDIKQKFNVKIINKLNIQI